MLVSLVEFWFGLWICCSLMYIVFYYLAQVLSVRFLHLHSYFRGLVCDGLEYFIPVFLLSVLTVVGVGFIYVVVAVVFLRVVTVAVYLWLWHCSPFLFLLFLAVGLYTHCGCRCCFFSVILGGDGEIKARTRVLLQQPSVKCHPLFLHLSTKSSTLIWRFSHFGIEEMYRSNHCHFAID